MFAKSRKEKFVEQAQDLAHDLTEAIAPHVERARDEIAPRFADARDQLAPRFADARDQLAPRLADARDQLAPHVDEARGRIAKGVATGVAAATPVAVEARRRGELAAAALKGEPVKRTGGRKKKLLVLAGLVGLGALAVQKLRGGNESANWQTSYTPTPAPAAPPAPPSPSAPMAGSHAADVAADSETGGDPVGATPGEALSDAAESPHPVTTPDAPAEDVEVKDPEKP
ncbi:MAG: hypothetical protein JWQ93_708 [Marmoricola sp.]|jgi:hypothetical protein|nr:hypothetical protein [Marmoricola sp.]